MSEVNHRDLLIELLKGGMAPKYARRTVRELRQHRSELVNEGLEQGLSEDESLAQANRKLGSKEEILREALAKPELRSWARKYTKTIFILSPIILYLLWVILALLLFTTASFFFPPVDLLNPPWWMAVVTRTVGFLNEYVYPVAFVLVFCLWAKRRYVRPFWPLLGLIPMTFLGAGFETFYDFDELRGASMTLNWGWAFFPETQFQATWPRSFYQFGEMAVLILLAYAVFRYYEPFSTNERIETVS